MKFKTILLGTAALALLATPALAQSATTTTTTTTKVVKHHHHHAAASTSGGSSIDARIDALENEIHEL